MKSLWENETVRPEFCVQDGDKRTDVLIVGGGIAGILCAYKLKNEGVDCLLVEKDRICAGVTGCTTAKISSGHGLIYDKLIKSFGEERARMYLEAQISAGREYEDLCKTIDCNYEKKDSYVYSLGDSRKVEKEIEALKLLGATADFSDAEELPFEVAGAVCLKDQAQFQPLRFLYAVAKGLPVFERTKVLEFCPGKISTNRGTISFEKMIVATHFPIFNKHGSYFLKMYQHRSYVLAMRGAQKLSGMYVDESDTGLSFRAYKDALLLGGGGHRTGKKGGCWQELEDFAKKHYRGAEIIDKWATQDCMTLDGVPYIGNYSGSTPDVFVATGFNKWGMTNAMAAASILCDMVMGRDNPYAEVFSPSRSVLRPQLAINVFESTLGLITPTVPRCPHLGCALRYNTAEHTWDCPCHGSRFSEDGTVLDGPSTHDHPSMGK